MYIVVTEVDHNTRIPCTVEPQRTGPSMPAVKGYAHIWHDQSTWPVSTDSTGKYLRAPKYYGTCDDDADTTIAGVLQVLTEAEYTAARTAEHEARKPYPSWIGYLDTMTWAAPVARPADAVMNGGNVRYQWDEATVNWVAQTPRSMKEFYFISGLPRSGSTLLSAILRQNPEFYADISSPVQGLVASTINVITGSESNHLVDEDRRKQILKDLFNAYYKAVTPNTVFDTSRGWTAKTSLLKDLYPQTKIICCVRDLPWILDSFERISAKNSLYGAALTDDESRQTVTTRCDALMDVKKEGQVVKPYYFLEEGLLLNPDMIMLVEYESLCKQPESVMREIYGFIGKPYFDHDFKNVEYENEVYDKALNMKSLHTVRKEVTWVERPSILPKSVWEKYSGKEFWRTPAPEFAIKQLYKVKG